MQSCSLVFFLLFLGFSSHAQDKARKKFKEGYVIYGSDTMIKKIYCGKDNDFSKTIILLTANDDQVSYAPGSYVKGFGIPSDSGLIHYTTLTDEVVRNGEMIKTKKYARILIDGKIRVFEVKGYNEMLHNNGTMNISTRSVSTSHYVSKNDSLHKLNFNFLTNLKKEDLSYLFEGYDGLLKSLADKFDMVNFILYVKQFNEWYEKQGKL